MAHQGISTLRASDLVVPRSPAASAPGPLAVDGLVAELSPYWRRDLPAHRLDFQRIVNQAVRLAKILTGASGSAVAFRGAQGTICLARSGEGAPPLGAPVDITSGLSKQCLDSGTSLRCDDIATDGRVDPEISRAIGIRAVAVVPIYSDDEISGILEVFSSTPGIFTDEHLQRLQELANWVGSAANTLRGEPICGSNVDVQLNGHPDITLLVELEPLYRSFFRNLADLLSPRSPARSASQMHGWNDVLVDCRIPWRRFLESVFLHIVVVGMLSGLSEIWPRELLLSPRPLREAQVTYYPFSQTFPARGSGRPAVHPSRQHTRLGAAPSVLPPPDIGEAEARQSHLPSFSVVAPPPDLSVGSGFHRIDSPRAGVVSPPPDLRGSMTRAGLIDAGQLGGGSAEAADISIVPPPPSINDHAVLTYGATGVGFRTGVPVVAPPPSIQTRAELDAKGRDISLAGGGSQVVPPPPSLEGAGNSVGGGRGNSLANGGSQVVPPPPSAEGAGNAGARGRASSLARADAEGVLPPASAQGAGNSELGGARVAKDLSAPSIPEVGGSRMHPILQDVQLRVIGLVWAPPRSSYFSNFEVFLAERWLNKQELQFIKLVYVFLPYQPRLTEYGLDKLKVRRLRVTRDPTCDESLMQMEWPEGENVPSGSHHSGDALESTSPDRNNALPCYRTTADDYRRAVLRSR